MPKGKSLAAEIVKKWKAKQRDNGKPDNSQRDTDMGKELLEAIKSNDAPKFARLMRDFARADDGE